MERYQYAVVNFLSHLGKVWVYASHNLELLTTSMMVSDRTPVCKVRAMVFPLKSRENPQRGICASLQRKWLFWMTRVQPRTDNLVRFASVILGILSFVKFERLTFVDLVTLPFFNLVTLRFVKITSSI